MAAPGTTTLNRHDSTNKQKVAYWDITTHPAGVKIQTGFHRIIFVQATWSEYIGTEPSTLQAVISSDKQSVTIFNTGELSKAASVTIIADP